MVTACIYYGRKLEKEAEINFGEFSFVPEGRLELPCPCERCLLKTVCLPFHHSGE